MGLLHELTNEAEGDLEGKLNGLMRSILARGCVKISSFQFPCIYEAKPINAHQ